MSKDKMPSTWSMVKSFTKELSNYVSQACEACEHYNKEKARCTLCGCKIEFKAQWKTSNCPDTPPRWKPQVISYGKAEEGNSTDSSN